MSEPIDLEFEADDQRAVKRRANQVVFGIVAILVAGFMVLVVYLKQGVDFTAATSPDGRYTAVVRQPGLLYLDRNFRLILIDRRTGAERQVFHSEDQTPTVQHEELIWSTDSQAIALVGDKYYVNPGSTLPDGRTLFLTYDLKTDTVNCNTDHGRGFTPAAPAAAVARFGARLTEGE